MWVIKNLWSLIKSSFIGLRLQRFITEKHCPAVFPTHRWSQEESSECFLKLCFWGRKLTFLVKSRKTCGGASIHGVEDCFYQTQLFWISYRLYSSYFMNIPPIERQVVHDMYGNIWHLKSLVVATEVCFRNCQRLAPFLLVMVKSSKGERSSHFIHTSHTHIPYRHQKFASVDQKLNVLIGFQTVSFSFWRSTFPFILRVRTDARKEDWF